MAALSSLPSTNISFSLRIESPEVTSTFVERSKKSKHLNSYNEQTFEIALKNFKESDPQEIVIDEFVGQSIPIILFEIFHGDRNYTAYEALQIYFWFFLLFRVFDGLKPFPIDYVEKKFKNTFGILFDDILAGFYVVLCLILFMVGKTYLLQ